MLNSLQTDSYKLSNAVHVEPRVGFFNDIIETPVEECRGNSIRYGNPIVMYTQQKKISNIFYKETHFETARYQVDTLLKEIYPGYDNE